MNNERFTTRWFFLYGYKKMRLRHTYPTAQKAYEMARLVVVSYRVYRVEVWLDNTRIFRRNYKAKSTIRWHPSNHVPR